MGERGMWYRIAVVLVVVDPFVDRNVHESTSRIVIARS